MDEKDIYKFWEWAWFILKISIAMIISTLALIDIFNYFA